MSLQHLSLKTTIHPGPPLSGKYITTDIGTKIQLNTITLQLLVSAMESDDDLSYSLSPIHSDYQDRAPTHSTYEDRLPTQSAYQDRSPTHSDSRDSVRSLVPARVLRHTGPSFNPRLLRDNHSLFRLPTPILPFRPSNLSSYRANLDREDDGEERFTLRTRPYISGPDITPQQTQDFLGDGLYPNFVGATFRVDISDLARRLIISPPNRLNLLERGYNPPRPGNSRTFEREPSRISLYPRLESPPLTPITAAMRWTHIWEWISSDSVYLPSPLLSFPDPETLPGCFADYRDFANCYLRVDYEEARSISLTGSEVE